MKRTSSPRARFGVVVLALLGSGCGARTSAPPSPETTTTLPPDMRGSRVMVLPIQSEAGVGGDGDAELAFALGAIDSGIDWILPDALDEALQRSPGLGARSTGLQVGMFLRSEVERVGDPLYGDLRRLGALVDADIALLPVRVAPGAPGASGQAPLEAMVALVMVRTGRVIWFGVVAGDPGAHDDPAVLASTMDRLARRLLWYVGD